MRQLVNSLPGRGRERARLFRRAAVLTAVLCLALPVDGHALGKRAASPPDPSAGDVRVEGTVRLVGSMPFPDLVISGGGADWYLEGRDRELLEPCQQREIIVEGRPEYIELVLANGKKAGTRRYLRDVRILERR